MVSHKKPITGKYEQNKIQYRENKTGERRNKLKRLTKICERKGVFVKGDNAPIDCTGSKNTSEGLTVKLRCRVVSDLLRMRRLTESKMGEQQIVLLKT
jgi:hypothetical protein